MEELILSTQNVNEEAFTKLILSINDDLYKIAKTRISNEDDIADAVQETMIETYKSIKNLIVQINLKNGLLHFDK